MDQSISFIDSIFNSFWHKKKKNHSCLFVLSFKVITLTFCNVELILFRLADGYAFSQDENGVVSQSEVIRAYDTTKQRTREWWATVVPKQEELFALSSFWEFLVLLTWPPDDKNGIIYCFAKGNKGSVFYYWARCFSSQNWAGRLFTLQFSSEKMKMVISAKPKRQKIIAAH